MGKTFGYTPRRCFHTKDKSIYCIHFTQNDVIVERWEWHWKVECKQFSACIYSANKLDVYIMSSIYIYMFVFVPARAFIMIQHYKHIQAARLQLHEETSCPEPMVSSFILSSRFEISRVAIIAKTSHEQYKMKFSRKIFFNNNVPRVLLVILRAQGGDYSCWL